MELESKDGKSENMKPCEGGRSVNAPLQGLFLVPSVLAMAWLVANAEWFWRHREDLGFGYGVPFVCGYLFYRAWATRPAERMRWGWSGVLLAGAGTILLFVTQIYQAAFGTMSASLMGLALGLMLMMAANLTFVFGPAGIRHFGLAYGFILLALPMPSAIESPVIFGLQSLVTSVDVEVLKAIGIPAAKMGSVIQLANGSVGVNEACSGIRSLQAMLMVTLILGMLELKNVSLRVLLIVLGVFWALFGNFLRSLFLSYIANAKGTEAVDTYHDAAGWSILIFTFAGVVLSAGLLSRLESVAIKSQPVSDVREDAPPVPPAE